MDPTILLFIKLHSDDGSFAEIVSVSRFFLQFLVNFQQITFWTEQMLKDLNQK